MSNLGTLVKQEFTPYPRKCRRDGARKYRIFDLVHVHAFRRVYVQFIYILEHGKWPSAKGVLCAWRLRRCAKN